VTIKILLFAQARERAGRRELSLEMPEGSRVADFVRRMRSEHPSLDPLWPHLAIAVDGRLVEEDAAAPLQDGAEVALLPPVSGG
jgi:molybdopterin converting factor small subunit